MSVEARALRVARLGALAVGLLTAGCFPAGAAASPLPPADLHLAGGDGWRATNGFDLRWSDVSASPAIASAHYLVRDPLGTTVAGPTEIAGAVRAIDGIWVPDVAATYTAEIWLEDVTGAEGPPAEVKLRFDPQRPDDVEPLPPTGWIGRTELPYAIRVTHPAGPQPASGIRGYAISIDRVAATSPCLDAYVCTDAETDLRGGIGDDALVVQELPEGTSYLHALAVTGAQVRSSAPGHAPIHVDRTDPVTRLSGLPEGWTNHSVVLEATAADSLSGMVPIAGGAPFTAIRIDGAPPTIAPGGSVTATVVAAGVHTISYYARDAAGNVNDGADSNGQANASPTTVPLRIDREPPAVVFAGSADPEDPELIEARVSDPLSGPDPSRGEIAVRAVGSTDPYEALPSFGAGDTLLGRWRSEDYPVGEYEFRVTGYDAAGNAGTGTQRANGAPMVLPNPLKARASLIAGFGEGFGQRATARIVRRGASATFGGRLTMGSDASSGDRSLTVIERFDPGASEQRRATTVATDEQGRFSVRLGAGPSREVFAVFGGTSTATGTASRPLRLGVRADVSLRASSPIAVVGGRPIVFRGAVASPDELPPGGATVQLQFRAAALPWSEFRTVQTNGRGRFRYAYRFSDDDSRGVRFRFRALVPAQSDWPYEPGGSRPVAVRGL
jgi:hypothetical protein